MVSAGYKTLESLPPDDHGRNRCHSDALVCCLQQLLDAVAVSSLFERTPKLLRVQADFLRDVSEHVNTSDVPLCWKKARNTALLYSSPLR